MCARAGLRLALFYVDLQHARAPVAARVFSCLQPAAKIPEIPMRSAVETSSADRKKLASDFPRFANEHISIRSKTGAIAPLAFNRAQRHVHALLDAQREKTGRVRALILKGRQQGCSTYVAARFFHRAMYAQGLRVYILTHEDAATQNLFDIVQRFQVRCEDNVRRATRIANANGMIFAETDSGYMLGTAGTKGGGRPSARQPFH